MITVIISTLNAEKTLGLCLNNLKSQCRSEEPLETMIVDAGSTDNTLAIARAAGARIIQNDGRNSAEARNEAIGQAQGEIICFTNGDCIPGNEWLVAITKPLVNSEIVGCKGAYYTEQHNLLARFIQFEFEEKYDRLQGEDSIDFIDGYSAAYKREVLVINRGFDEHLPRLEDQELSYRLASRGYRMVFVRRAWVGHEHITRMGEYWLSKFQTAFWKSQVVRMYPDRAYSDSYTPQMLKIQMILVASLLFSLILSLVSAKAGTIPILLALGFLLSTLPFLKFSWQRDRRVAILAPFFMALRTSALISGYFLGAIRFSTKSGDHGNRIGGLNYVIKRGFDIVGSLPGLALLLISYPWIGLLIRFTSPGPVIYAQERVGRGGKIFTMYKFRTMIVGADNAIGQPIIGREPNYKLADDPRITPAGRFLRRWSLDELPQFWNVLKGDMSLVGPRPEQTAIVAMYDDHHRLRLMVKPGITGPMQVGGRADLALNDRVSLEVEYIENYSLVKDLWILSKTIPAVLVGRGAR